MNPPLQGKDQTPVDADLSPSNFILNHLSAQQRIAHQVGLQQRDSLFLMRDHRRNDNFLAAAVQQQLVASLTSPTMQLYGNLGSQPHMHPDLSGGLLSRAQQNQHNATSLVQRLSGQSTSPHSYFSIGMSPKLLDSLVREATSGTKRPTTAQQIPCLARGMATDHNSMTAYFEIAIDVTHGQHLYCSHPVCRAAGVKFRYCLYCKKPVTKQNFRSRHLHADVVSATSETTANGASGKKRKYHLADIDSTGSDPASNERGEGSHEDDDDRSGPNDVVIVAKVQENYGRRMSPNNSASGKRSSEAEAQSSHLSTAIVSRAVEIMQDGERMELQGKDSEAQVLHESNSGNYLLIDPDSCHDPSSMTASNTKPHDETCDKMTRKSKGLSLDTLIESGDRTDTTFELENLHRRRLWLTLFSKRPQDLGHGIDTWLSQVLVVSDPARSWNSEGDKVVDGADCEMNAGSDVPGLRRRQEPSSSQLAKWLGLLGTRPETSVEGSRATAWLKRVLEVSCQHFEDDDSTMNEAEHRILKT